MSCLVKIKMRDSHAQYQPTHCKTNRFGISMEPHSKFSFFSKVKVIVETQRCQAQVGHETWGLHSEISYLGVSTFSGAGEDEMPLNLC